MATVAAAEPSRSALAAMRGLGWRRLVLTVSACGLAAACLVARPAAACAPSVAFPPPSPTICLGDVAVLDGSGIGFTGCVGAVHHEWRDESGMLVSTQATFGFRPMATARYDLRTWCDDDPACTLTDEALVTVEQPPVMRSVLASDADACNLGVLLEWPPAEFHGAAGTGVYSVYRGRNCTDALARPPVVMGLVEPHWEDWDIPLGVMTFYYVVAEDDWIPTVCMEGPHHRGAIGMQCVMGFDDTQAPLPDGVFTTLFLRHDGDEIEAYWPVARALLADEHFHLKKAWLRPDDVFELVTPEGHVARTFVETDTSAWLQFFDLRVANPCERESEAEYPPGLD